MAAAITGRSRSALRARALLALAGVTLLAFLALVVLLAGAELADGAPAHAAAAQASSSSAAQAEHEHSLPPVQSVRQQPSTRARTPALGLLTATVLVAVVLVAR